jgi:Spy/CpxP family protein refolding chaperone
VRKFRVEILLIGLTVLALSAGVVAGLVAARLPGSSSAAPVAPPPPPPGNPLDRTPLAEELGLTPQQRDQMRGIWEPLRGKVHETFEDAQDLQRQRDEDLVAMLNDEQKAKFAKISRDYADRFVELGRRRDKLFDDAVARTRQMLTPEQREKYEQILRQHRPPGEPPAPGTFTAPGSQPAGARAARDTDGQPH